MSTVYSSLTRARAACLFTASSTVIMVPVYSISAPRKLMKHPLVSLVRALRDSQLAYLLFVVFWLVAMIFFLGMLLSTFERDGELAEQARARADVELVRSSYSRLLGFYENPESHGCAAATACSACFGSNSTHSLDPDSPPEGVWIRGATGVCGGNESENYSGCTRVCMLRMPTSAQVSACAVAIDNAPTTPQGYVLNPLTFDRQGGMGFPSGQPHNKKF